MGNTLTGQTVLLFGAQRDIWPHPVIQLGIDANGQPQAMAVSSGGASSVSIGANGSTTATTWTQATKTVAASGTPERLAATTTLCDCVILEGKLSRTGNNTGNVFIGTTSGNDTQLLMIAPGNSLVLTAPDGKKIDLNLIYVDVATNADGITYTAFN